MTVVLGWAWMSAVRCGLCTVVAGVVMLSATGAAWAAPGDTTLVSRASGPAGAAGNGFSEQASISADGSRVAFRSDATNLSGANRAKPHVLVRDLSANTTTVINRASGAAGAMDKGDALDPAISADGRFVAFDSSGSNLIRGDRNHKEDVFVRDLVSQETTLVSRASGPGGAAANGYSVSPSISADGRFVVFVSIASNLSRADRDRRVDVFVRDRHAHTTTLVNRADGRAGAKCKFTGGTASISADGRFVAFNCYGRSNVHRLHQVLVRDLRRGTTTLVSQARRWNFGPRAYPPTISPNGRFVAFATTAGGLIPDLANTEQVLAGDLGAGQATLASRATGADGGPGNQWSVSPSLSADGRLVAFASSATNLTADDTDQDGDIFVRDRVSETTTLVSRASGNQGAKGNRDSVAPALSANGQFVAFVSTANNLTPDALNPGPGLSPPINVFVRELEPPS